MSEKDGTRLEDGSIQSIIVEKRSTDRKESGDWIDRTDKHILDNHRN